MLIHSLLFSRGATISAVRYWTLERIHELVKDTERYGDIHYNRFILLPQPTDACTVADLKAQIVTKYAEFYPEGRQYV